MAKVIFEPGEREAKEINCHAIEREKRIIRLCMGKTEGKLEEYRNKYGELDREKLYGIIDDMELIEWEGEIENF